MNHVKSYPSKTTFEKTPSYLFDPKAAYRIKSVVPYAKIIMLLRDPVKRAYSHYKMNKRLFAREHIMTFDEWGLVRREPITTFEQCIENDIKLLKRAGVIPENEIDRSVTPRRSLTKEDLDRLNEAWRKYVNSATKARAKCGTIIGRGIYSLQLNIWWKVYNNDERRKQFLVIRSEDLKPDTVGNVDIRNITNFIGISDRKVVSEKRIHGTGEDAGPICNETEDRLRRLYLPFNAALDEFLGSTSSWHDPWSW